MATIRDLLLPEFDTEMPKTRRALERIPPDRFGWKPHDKSWTMGELATHVVNVLTWTRPTIASDELDFASPDAPQRPEVATTVDELLSRFDANAADAREAIASATDESMLRPWTLRMGDRVFFTQPKFLVLRGFVFSHHIHHRAQLGLYLRLNDVPVPQLFGPTADEPM